MHYIQREILARLLRKNGSKYTTVAKNYTQEDNFLFHLNKLIAEDLIEKRDDKYFITLQGIKKAESFEHETLLEFPVKSLIVGFILKFQNKYVLKRHETDSGIFYNLPSSQLFREYSIRDELKRSADMITGGNLDAEQFVFDSLHMKRILTPAKELIFDDVFVVYSYNLGQPPKQNEVYELYGINEICKLQNCWPEVDFCILRKNWSVYLEYEFSSKYLLQ